MGGPQVFSEIVADIVRARTSELDQRGTPLDDVRPGADGCTGGAIVVVGKPRRRSRLGLDGNAMASVGELRDRFGRQAHASFTVGDFFQDTNLHHSSSNDERALQTVVRRSK